MFISLVGCCQTQRCVRFSHSPLGLRPSHGRGAQHPLPHRGGGGRTAAKADPSRFELSNGDFKGVGRSRFCLLSESPNIFHEELFLRPPAALPPVLELSALAFLLEAESWEGFLGGGGKFVLFCFVFYSRKTSSAFKGGKWQIKPHPGLFRGGGGENGSAAFGVL